MSAMKKKQVTRKPTVIRVHVTDEDGTLLDQHNIDLIKVEKQLRRGRSHDLLAILAAADEARDMVADEITAALRRRQLKT